MWPGASAFRIWSSAAICLAARMLSASDVTPLDSDFTADYIVDKVPLPQEATPRAILQTRDGYLWIGTYKGLGRFDGVRQVGFHVANEPTLSSDATTEAGASAFFSKDHLSKLAAYLSSPGFSDR